MEIRVRATGAVMTDTKYKKNNPNVSFPKEVPEGVWNSLGVDVVYPGQPAQGGTVYQHSVHAGVEFIDGKWYSKFTLGPVFETPEQEQQYKAQIDADKARIVRSERDSKLASCDWTQVSDAPVDKQAWALYRQALRDVPAQSGFPWDIQWPTEP